MADVEINDLGSVGLIRDRPAYMLPPEAWNAALNVRFYNSGVEKMKGWSTALGTPNVAPHFALPVISASQGWVIYVNLTSAHVYDGSTHTNITRAAGAYTAVGTESWNGTILGGIPILNNGSDAPQFWADYNTAIDLADLENWPSGVRARVLRALGPFLVAVNLTIDGEAFPHRVRWSHPADPGALPPSWALDNPSFLGGHVDLPDVEAGLILDELPLQGDMYIYKQGSVTRMRFIGGTSVFDFDTFLETVGLLSTRCVCLGTDGASHVFATNDDIVVHNGANSESILDKRMRRTLFSQIDPTYYTRSFIFANPAYDEIWFCYPEVGEEQPNRALVWNRGENKIYEADGITFRNATVFQSESSSGTLWSDLGAVDWASVAGTWATAYRRKVLLSAPGPSEFYILDDGTQRKNKTFKATLTRTGLSIVGRDRAGKWLEDFKQRKMVTRVWPKAEGIPFNVKIGYQETPAGAVDWTQKQEFKPETELWVDFGDESGRLLAIEIESTKDGDWRLEGYKLEMSLEGTF